jgi:predicted phage terminase large subunit-like protein
MLNKSKSSPLPSLLRQDLASFVHKGLAETFGISNGGEGQYIDVLCARLSKLESGDDRRLVVNLPPRHLKTTLCSELFPAWVLGRSPDTRIMVVTCSEVLSREIAHKTRFLIQSSWFSEIFPTSRLAVDKKAVMDFSTTKGGGLFATTIGGAITGRGADLIIIDDPIEIRDAADETRLTYVNEYFDTVISSRLNNPATDCMLIVAHRLNTRDLSGHVLEQGGWGHVCLPMIATSSTNYQTCSGYWLRQAEELLRPGAYSGDDVLRLRASSVNPDFETLYQQNPDGEWAVRIEAEHFASFGRGGSTDNIPIVLSIDPGHVAGRYHSYSVIQAWRQRKDIYLLIDQWREQADQDDFLKALSRMRLKHHSVNILIERTGFGFTAIAEAKRRRWVKVWEIVPDSRSKKARLREHAPKILSRHISLPADAAWRNEFIDEFVRFPHGEFDDQVDAATQYLDWVSRTPSPTLKVRPTKHVVYNSGNRITTPPGGGRFWARQHKV